MKMNKDLRSKDKLPEALFFSNIGTTANEK